MTKKRLELVGNIFAIIIFAWGVFSVLEIGMRSPLAESHEYSAWNLVTLLIDLFGGVG